MTVFAYLRVSTQEQGDHGISLEAQEATLRQEAERRGWTPTFVSEVASAGGKRPEFDRLLNDLTTGDVLLVTMLDRMVRSNYQFAGILEQSQQQGWQLVMLYPNVDTTDPYGRAFAQTASIWAELERALGAQRTRAAMAVKKSTGKPWTSRTGRRCTGYGNPNRIPVDVRERILKEAPRIGLAPMARALNEDKVPTAHGGRQWWPSTVQAVLRRAA